MRRVEGSERISQGANWLSWRLGLGRADMRGWTERREMYGGRVCRMKQKKTARAKNSRCLWRKSRGEKQ